MSKKEYFIDDRVIIPDYIKKMSLDELDREIARLEDEIRQKHAKEKAEKVNR